MIPSGATSGDAMSNFPDSHILIDNNSSSNANTVHRKSKSSDGKDVNVHGTYSDQVKMKNVNEGKNEEHPAMSKKLTVASRGAHFLPSGETNFMFDSIQ